MTLDKDRAEVQRVAVSWQGVPELEQEAMLARLGRIRTVEAGLGR